MEESRDVKTARWDGGQCVWGLAVHQAFSKA